MKVAAVAVAFLSTEERALLMMMCCVLWFACCACALTAAPGAPLAPLREPEASPSSRPCRWCIAPSRSCTALSSTARRKYVRVSVCVCVGVWRTGGGGAMRRCVACRVCRVCEQSKSVGEVGTSDKNASLTVMCHSRSM